MCGGARDRVRLKLKALFTMLKGLATRAIHFGGTNQRKAKKDTEKYETQSNHYRKRVKTAIRRFKTLPTNKDASSSSFILFPGGEKWVKHKQAHRYTTVDK